MGPASSSEVSRCRTEVMAKRLAIFDFDGTITIRNTFAGFLFRAVPWHRQCIFLMAIPFMMIAFRFGWLSVKGSHRFLVGYLLRRQPLEHLERVGERFAQGMLRRLIRPAAAERIAWHRVHGDDVVVVSASYEYWIRPWCLTQGIDWICSTLEVIDGRATGRSTCVCDGEQKVIQLRQRYCLESYDTIYAYGDSEGDREMMRLADHAEYAPFRGHHDCPPRSKGSRR